jgi:hypothetical protein
VERRVRWLWKKKKKKKRKRKKERKRKIRRVLRVVAQGLFKHTCQTHTLNSGSSTTCN